MFVYYNPNPKDKHTGDCVIRAICKALDAEWLDVYLALCLLGAEIGDWGNVNSVWDRYLKERGFTREVIPNTCPQCYTIADFCRDHAEGTYILATGTHAVCVDAGRVYDTWDSSNEIPLYFYEKRE